MTIKQQLIQMIGLAQISHDDRFNPETYKDTTVQGESGRLNFKIVLGNLFAKGYLNDSNINFEIFKDHSGWQIWAWDYNSERPECNQFNTPYYKYDEVIKFINSL
jgi:hypothetical protein